MYSPYNFPEDFDISDGAQLYASSLIESEPDYFDQVSNPVGNLGTQLLFISQSRDNPQTMYLSRSQEDIQVEIIEWLDSQSSSFLDKGTFDKNYQFLVRDFTQRFPTQFEKINRKFININEQAKIKKIYGIKTKDGCIIVEIFQILVEAIQHDVSPKPAKVYTIGELLAIVWGYLSQNISDAVVGERRAYQTLQNVSRIRITTTSQVNHVIYLFEPAEKINRSTSDLEVLESDLEEIYRNFLGIKVSIEGKYVVDSDGIFKLHNQYTKLVNQMISRAIGYNLLQPIMRDILERDIPFYMPFSGFEKLYNLIRTVIRGVKAKNSSINGMK